MSLAARVAAASRVRLLFLHATGFCKEVWAPCLAHLVSMVPTSQTATFDWLDFPGHGTRGHVRDTNWSDWGASLAPVVLDHLAGPPDAAAAAATAAQSDNADVDGQPLLVVVGHSMGAAAAALTELAAPGTFSGMVLFEPIIMDDEMRAVGTPLGDMARRRRASYPSPDDALRRWRGRGAFEGWDDRALRAYVHAGLELRGDGQYHLRCTPEVEVSCPLTLHCGELLTQLRAPTREASTTAVTMDGHACRSWTCQSM